MFHDHTPGRDRARTIAAAGLTAIMAVAVGGCASSHVEAGSAPGNLSFTAHATPTPSVTTAGSGRTKASPHTASPSMPGGTATRPANPLAGHYVPVMRNGKRPHPTISAGRQPFSKAVTYSDGLALRTGNIVHGVETGYGPGVFHGSPTTQLSVTMTNHTKKVIDLQQVVVQMVYGSTARVSPPVYNDAAADFSGVLKPGQSQTAKYVFSVPTSDLGDVTMTVDMDSVHAAAVFTGSIRN